MTIQELRNKLEREKGQRDQITEDITNTKKAIRQSKRSLIHHERAREIIREVGQKTQAQLQFHISEITSLALSAVFPNPYELEVEFVLRRNKTECDLWFSRNGNRVDPMDATGGGAVDVAAFALRAASWSMQSPRSRAVLFLDEPFKNLSTDLMPRAGEMLNQISKELQLQIIMVTHEEELVESADKVFKVKLKKGISEVTAIGE